MAISRPTSKSKNKQDAFMQHKKAIHLVQLKCWISKWMRPTFNLNDIIFHMLCAVLHILSSLQRDPYLSVKINFLVGEHQCTQCLSLSLCEKWRSARERVCVCVWAPEMNLLCVRTSKSTYNPYLFWKTIE